MVSFYLWNRVVNANKETACSRHHREIYTYEPTALGRAFSRPVQVQARQEHNMDERRWRAGSPALEDELWTLDRWWEGDTHFLLERDAGRLTASLLKWCEIGSYETGESIQHFQDWDMKHQGGRWQVIPKLKCLMSCRWTHNFEIESKGTDTHVWTTTCYSGLWLTSLF